jgi:hypothetical protein
MDTIENKYCRCVFHVMGKQNPECMRYNLKPRSVPGCYNPYAVCNASVYKRRGLKGYPISCFKRINLNDLTYRELLAYAVHKESVLKYQGFLNRDISVYQLSPDQLYDLMKNYQDYEPY